tara:strand:+ start:446 stop:727 length:282 start_codon:yes stop_codon:yes gene_type:complete
MLRTPQNHFRQLKREIVTIPHVEQKRQNRAFVGADGFLEEFDGVLWQKILGESVSLDQEVRDMEGFGKESPGLSWGHDLAPFEDYRCKISRKI